MIRYRLQCSKRHEFEAWFASSAAFDRQAKRKLVTCPVCDDSKVQKTLMAPGVVTSERKAASRKRKQAAAPVAEPSAEPASLVMTAEQREVLTKLRALRDAMLSNSDYVGPRFAEEARRIHSEGDKAKGRSIHGEASPDEVRSLTEDGIDVLPVPVLPDDKN